MRFKEIFHEETKVKDNIIKVIKDVLTGKIKGNKNWLYIYKENNVYKYQYFVNENELFKFMVDRKDEDDFAIYSNISKETKGWSDKELTDLIKKDLELQFKKQFNKRDDIFD